jgi:beta-N-acetylhexosaminidase
MEFCSYDINSFSLSEKVGQLIITYINGTAVDKKIECFIRENLIGGILLFNWSNSLESPEQIKKLTDQLQNEAIKNNLPPFFIAADQEGGAVVRFKNGFTEFPGNRSLGIAESVALTKQAYQVMGREMRQVGANFAFAPVVDVNSNPDNPVIGVRSFGDDPELVAKLGTAAVEGFSEAGIISCIKHFPGHGDVSVDSHLKLPTSNKTIEELQKSDLIPFAHINNLSPAIMTAHISIPSIDERCATLSKPILTDLLRKKMGYKGLILSDSLTMGGIVEQCGDIGEAAVQAFEAGCDLLVVVGGKKTTKYDPSINDENMDPRSQHIQDIRAIRLALIQAIKTNRISIDRLHESLTRIMEAKEKYIAAKQHESIRDFIVEPELNNLIAEKSIKVVRYHVGFPFKVPESMLISTSSMFEIVNKSLFRQVPHLFFEGLNPDSRNFLKVLNGSYSFQSIIFLSVNAWQNQGQKDLIQQLSSQFPIMLIALKDSRDADLAPNAKIIITTSSPTSVALNAVSNELDRLNESSRH